MSAVTAPAESVRDISDTPKATSASVSPNTTMRRQARERDAGRTKARRLSLSNTSRRCTGIATGDSGGMPGGGDWLAGASSGGVGAIAVHR